MCSLPHAAVRFLDGHRVVEKGGYMPSQSPFCIELADGQRAVLKKRARAHTAPYWEVVRARIVLLASEGTSNKEIAARLDTSPQVVCKWRKRFYEEGLAGLEDRPRSGRPPTFSPRGEDGGEGAGL
jgi:transposase-like protein